MTDTAVVETPAVEATTVEATTEVPAIPVLANLADADAVTQATVPVAITLIHANNAIVTKNASCTKGVDEIVADLVNTSQDPKVLAITEKMAELSEQRSKHLIDQAKAMKAESGEPDLEAEKSAAKAMNGVLSALSTFPDGKRVGHFLPEILKGSVRVGSGVSSITGPKQDKSAVRTWARANGFPDLSDKGRLSEEILDAYAKANPGK